MGNLVVRKKTVRNHTKTYRNMFCRALKTKQNHEFATTADFIFEKLFSRTSKISAKNEFFVTRILPPEENKENDLFVF